MNKENKIREDIDRPVSDHLQELRKRLVIVFLSLLAATTFFYFITPSIIDLLKQPVKSFNLEFAFFTMTGAFTTRLKLALITSIVTLSPLIYFELMAFIGPGLTLKERKLVYKSFFTVVPMFAAGLVFGYIFIVPKALNFLIAYGSLYMNPVLSGEKYLSFMALLCILIGIIAAIPVILIYMARLGLLSSKLLKKIRKFIIFTLLIGEGIIVGDLMSFMIIGLPFIIVYEVSLCIVIFIEKRRLNAAKKAGRKKLLEPVSRLFSKFGLKADR